MSDSVNDHAKPIIINKNIDIIKIPIIKMLTRFVIPKNVASVFVELDFF